MISRQSVLQDRPQNVRKEIAEELGVQMLMESSVQQAVVPAD